MAPCHRYSRHSSLGALRRKEPKSIWKLRFDFPPRPRGHRGGILADLALRTAAIEDNKAQLAQLELVDPEKEALKRLAPAELRSLRQFTADREDGTQLSPYQVAIARKLAAFERDIRATKLRRLSRS